jgi:hypothetical protein
MTTVIDEEDEVPAPTWCRRCNRPTEVTMDQFHGHLHVVLSLTGERCLMMLADETPTAHLVHMLHLRQPANHVISGQLAQRQEVEVPLPRMPQPHLLRPACQ